jgi:hypothetical protein
LYGKRARELVSRLEETEECFFDDCVWIYWCLLMSVFLFPHDPIIISQYWYDSAGSVTGDDSVLQLFSREKNAKAV